MYLQIMRVWLALSMLSVVLSLLISFNEILVGPLPPQRPSRIGKTASWFLLFGIASWIFLLVLGFFPELPMYLNQQIASFAVNSLVVLGIGLATAVVTGISAAIGKVTYEGYVAAKKKRNELVLEELENRKDRIEAEGQILATVSHFNEVKKRIEESAQKAITNTNT